LKQNPALERLTDRNRDPLIPANARDPDHQALRIKDLAPRHHVDAPFELGPGMRPDEREKSQAQRQLVQLV
jgi:hypothetical protein